MADPFEEKLAGLFEEAPAFEDETAFTARFERRLARETLVRRAWLWGAGVVGAAIAIGQGFASGLGDRIAGLGGGLSQDLTAVMNGSADGAVVATPSLAAAAIALSIAALVVIGLRAAEA